MKELEKAVLSVMMGKKEEQVDEAALSAKQKKIAKLAGDPDKIEGEDLAKLRGEETEIEEGWDDMIKAAKARSGPQPSGGSGIKQGTRYGGSKQKPEKEEKNEKEEVKEETVVEYTFSDYLQVAKAKFGGDDAVRIANEAYNKKDISLFSSYTEA